MKILGKIWDWTLDHWKIILIAILFFFLGAKLC